MAETLRLVFANLENSAKTNASLGFVLRIIESDYYRHSYAHENSLLFNTSQLNDFKGVTLETINAIEDLTDLNISIYEIEVGNDRLVGVLSRRGINKHSRSVTLLSYPHHICYTKDLNAVFNCFRCESCYKYFRKHTNLGRHFPVCNEKVKENFPNSAYKLKETMFENLSSLELQFLRLQTFQKSRNFYFESI